MLENEAHSLLPEFCPLFQIHFMNRVLHQVVLPFPAAIQHSRMLRSVVFPAPDGPMMVTNSPRRHPW